MKILAGSIQHIAEAFLHPGYVSSGPRAITPDIYEPGAHQNIDLVEAFRLTGDALASAQNVNEGATTVAATASTGQWPFFFASILCLFGVLWTAYLLRDWLKAPKNNLKKRLLLPIAAILTTTLILIACGELEGDPQFDPDADTTSDIDADIETNTDADVTTDADADADDEADDDRDAPVFRPDPLPETIPWEGIELREYENPELATQALLHGIIADALMNLDQPIESLPNLQNEVGLPTNEPTEGQAYALSTYGIDGWGREFRVSGPENNQSVTSAGPDGEFETADDISLSVFRCDSFSFDSRRHAYFLRKNAGEYYVFFHRFSGGFFRYNNEPLAESMTGSDLFDVWISRQLYDDQLEDVRNIYDEIARSSGHEPLILQFRQ